MTTIRGAFLATLLASAPVTARGQASEVSLRPDSVVISRASRGIIQGVELAVHARGAARIERVTAHLPPALDARFFMSRHCGRDSGDCSLELESRTQRLTAEIDGGLEPGDSLVVAVGTVPQEDADAGPIPVPVEIMYVGAGTQSETLSMRIVRPPVSRLRFVAFGAVVVALVAGLVATLRARPPTGSASA